MFQVNSVANRRDNTCFNASCLKNPEVKEPDLQPIFLLYQYASTLITVRLSNPYIHCFAVFALL